MGPLDRMIQAIAKRRGWAVGPAVVQRSDQLWGFDDQQWSPTSYGDYITSSNGVYSCVRMRSQMLAQLPLKAYRRAGDGALEEITAGPVLDLLRGVNPHWTLNRLMWMTEASLSLWGEAFWYVERGESGTQPPSELWWMRPDKMTVVPHQDDYIRGYIYEDGTQRIPFERGEIVWIRYPNPVNEFAGLSPLAAAKLAADVGTAAMASNRAIFKAGNVPAGVMMPDKDQGLGYTDAQMNDLLRYFDKRLTGVDKRHRIAILKQRAEFQQLSWSPRDAEFVGSLGASLEEVARAYGVPLFLLGVREGTTFANLAEARKAIWTQTLIPEAEFVAAELTEQLLPMFGGAAPDVLAFDWSDLPELQDDEAERWERAQSQIAAGVMTINEWRTEQGLDPVAWGDVAWLPMALVPVSDGEVAIPTPSDEPEPEPLPEPEPRRQRDMAYDSPEHRAAFEAFTRRTDELEERTRREVAALFERQAASIIAQIEGGRAVRLDLSDIARWFQRARWVREFRVAARRFTLRNVIEAAGDVADGAGLDAPDMAELPAAARFIERRAQRFAREVNETTWQALRSSLAEGIAAGESRKTLSGRVQDVMGPMSRERARMIARTEVIGAYNGGGVLAAREMGLRSKRWVSSLDARVRDSHSDLHGDTVAIDEDFRSPSGARGPAPGNLGRASEDINCRCSLAYSINPPPRIVAGAQTREVTP